MFADDSAQSITTGRRFYRNTFLDQVIARIDFATPIAIVEQGPPKSVLEAARSNFPVADIEKAVERELRISRRTTQISDKELVEYRYHSQDRRKKIQLTQQYVFIEYTQKKYDRFETLLHEFLPIVRALREAFPDATGRRIGLRYINHLEPPDNESPFEWRQYVRENLLSVFDVLEPHDHICRALHWLELNDGEMRLRFQYGMPNPDYPAAVRKKTFTLDYDGFSEEVFELADAKRYLARFHSKIVQAFESVILPALRTIMEPIDER